MSENLHFSTIDPELASIVVALPPDENISIEARRERYQKDIVPKAQQNHKSLLPQPSEYNLVDHQIDVGNGASVLARCVTPTPGPGEDGTFPLFFWVHGGGWIAGDVNMDDYHLRRTCVDLRISIVNCEYRLAPEHPFPIGLNDCYAALKYVAAHPDVFSASLRKGFIVGGASAGGNLAAVIVHRARDDPFFKDTPITGQLLQIPCLIHPKAQPDKYKSALLSMEQNKDAPSLSKAAMELIADLYNAPLTDPEMSPILLSSHKGLPPAYIQVCGLDPLRDEGILYKKLLEEAGVPAKLEVYPGVPHLFDVFYPSLKQAKKYIEDYRDGIRWLNASRKAERTEGA
ncbi:hypothetical protein V5O48_013708 [Marasmius crinis-equi]|uniref:Alpha/beta hydrolase fold-3 domain-containing protein n=1 Tax=Marasmius crinis-equi TaxID=585013 RepID=A0ABR3EZC6_9AGAR